MKRASFFAIGTILFCLLNFAKAEAQSPLDIRQEITTFVQDFYDWYAPFATNYKPDMTKPVASYIAALKQKPAYFDATITKALLDDAAAPNDSEGIDMDAFLAAQDDVDGCIPGTIKQVGDKYRVEIHYTEKGKSRAAILAKHASFTAEVIKVAGHWKFSNFIYGTDSKIDLLTLLKNLKAQRLKEKK